MKSYVLHLICCLVAFNAVIVKCNEPPTILNDNINTVISEDTPVGAVIATINAEDPEGGPIRFGIESTDVVAIDQRTGQITLSKPLDREASDVLSFQVIVEDEVDDKNGAGNNVLNLSMNIIITDVNDNPPTFLHTPYDITVAEDTAVNSTIFSNITVEDPDLIGDFEVTCETFNMNPVACEIFNVVSLNAGERSYQGGIILRKTLNYDNKQLYRFLLNATDGKFNTTTTVNVRVLDVQNSPPVFQGALTTVVEEDTAVGSHVLTVQAKDGDRGNPRTIVYDLLTNPLDYFTLDGDTGDLKTAKLLDREMLADTNGVLLLTVRARELVDGALSTDANTSATADVSVTIRDANDEAPKFNKKEYFVSIPENLPTGSPLPNLDMTVVDSDIGNNSAFSLHLEDVSGVFAVEPESAVGSTSVILRLTNSSLDYENPNQRKFIVLVVAEDVTAIGLSSTATVTVEVTDVNDNAPEFENPTYTATVNESSLPGTVLTTIVATDRDSANGANVIYQLVGDGEDRFNVNKKTGVITVALCQTPGKDPCLDYETKSTYFLTYKAADDEGRGHVTSVPLKILVVDSNDNPPIFKMNNYTAEIDEGSTNFEPKFFVQAEDADKTSSIEYSIQDEEVKDLFHINPETGEILVINDIGLFRSNESDEISFVVVAHDGYYTADTIVTVKILDVNNNEPQFLFANYTANVPEDAEIGHKVLTVSAVDNDSGINAEITYGIERGSFEDFAIDNETGVIRVASRLDYDRRNKYTITVVASDKGTPMMTGTTAVTLNILNMNDKNPYFDPSLQRAEVPKDANVGTKFYKMKAADLDINSTDVLSFEISEPITAVDKHGKEIEDNDSFKDFFLVEEGTGEVYVAKQLNRDVAAVVRLTVVVTDTSAKHLQQGKGDLMVTILDVNDIPPVFSSPWTKENPFYKVQIQEEQPVGTILSTFVATDTDSEIHHYAIEPPSKFFEVNETTGTVSSINRIDYEVVQRVNFTLVAYDIGEPQLSTQAFVIVEVVNINDMAPVFEQREYRASIKENSPKDTSVINVTATDKDLGEYGRVRYTFKGDYVEDFTIDENSGEIRVSSTASLDREKTSDILLKVEASDGALPDDRKSDVVPVYVKIEDVNDNGPVFTQHHYAVNIVETIPYSPPSPIVQLQAEDKDDKNRLRYHIVNGNDEEAFYLDSSSGILYPKRSLLGLSKQFQLTVEVSDGKFTDKVNIDINVLDVNQNKPLFVEPSSSNSSLLILENVEVNYLVMKVHAEDKDPGENGRVTYHFKLGNNNTQFTDEFSIDEDSGELRTKIPLDREKKSSYQLILVARDHGSQTTYESLLFLNIMLKDVDDNKPMFKTDKDGFTEYSFEIAENNPENARVGKIEAYDPDEGENSKVFYYIVKGNENGDFMLDRRDGSIYAVMSLDKEKNSSYEFFAKATNNPNYNAAVNEIIAGGDPTIAHIRIVVKDENDNPPVFNRNTFYAGVNAFSAVGEYVGEVNATDADDGLNGELRYEIVASHLFKAGSNRSSGSVVPSPFTIDDRGKIQVADLVAVYNQDRFELNVVAREVAEPYREAVAIVNVWVYEIQQLVRVIVSRPPLEVHSEVHQIAAELSNATGNILVVDAVRYHINAVGQIQHDWCDMYMHMIDNTTQTIITIPDVLKLIDNKYDYLKNYYAGYAIENVLPAYSESTEEPFEPALAALVALLIVLIVGCISVLVLCCCFRHWIIMEPMNRKCDMLIKKPIIDDLSTTENPLWIEQKLKLYEEQELTMQVFCEPEAGRITSNTAHERHGSDDTSVVDNTYATIQHPGRRNSVNTMLSMSPGDYATLGGSVLPLDKTSSHSQQMIEAALGFQGCTFQVPDAPADTTELLRARSELRMNKDGQPEFVSELM